MSLPRKLRAPSSARRSRNEVLENSAFMNDRPSETIVPLPTPLRYGFSCRTSTPKFEPLCTSGRPNRYPTKRR